MRTTIAQKIRGSCVCVNLGSARALACWSRRPRRDELFRIHRNEGYPASCPLFASTRKRTRGLRRKIYDNRVNLLRQDPFEVRDSGKLSESPGRAATAPLLQHRLVKLVPIVEIVQVHRVFWRRRVIRNVACAQNPLARFVVVIVAAHGRVVLFDCVAI